jgi:chemotaxis protein MotB
MFGRFLLGRSRDLVASGARTALILVILADATGCVEKGLYTQALADLQFARNQAAQANDKLRAAQAELQSLQADIAARDAKLNELTATDADLHRKFEELNVLNQALTERLQKAGQSVESLSTEKGSLAQTLAETRKQLDELKKQQAAAEARAAEFQALIAKFQKLADAGKLKVVMRDGRMIIELPNDVLFDSGHDDLKAEGKATLGDVAKVLKTVPDRKFQVAGHTDNVKIATAKFPSNWELSAARAVTVTRLLQADGVPPDSLSAAGYGEYAPAVPNDTPENRAKNRRIEITLVPNIEEFVKIAGPPAAASEPAKPGAAPPAKPGAPPAPAKPAK